jgi:L-fuculose-phosphate aldolase
MHHQEAAELRAGREQLVRYGIRLLDDGLAVGTAGNLSLRIGASLLITPSGVGYRDLTPDDICVVSMPATPAAADTAQAAGPGGSTAAAAAAGPAGDAGPAGNVSSELPLHLAVYAATGAGAVVHTHSPEVVALSTVHDELPAIHYAITGLGGPVRVAGYERFGSGRLAQAAAAALDGRRAVILRNHGAVSYGTSLAQAYDRALVLEWLAHVYRMACTLGEPRLLSAADLDEVAAEMRRRRYGEPR